MKREQLRELGLNDEQIDAIMSANGNDINELKKQNEALTSQVATMTSERDNIIKEYDEFKKSKMTDEELAKAKAEEERVANEALINSAKEAEAKYNRLCLETRARGVLVTGGIKDEDLEKFVSTVIGADEEETVSRAQNLVDYVNSQREIAKNQAIQEVLNKTPNPQPSNQPENKEKFEVGVVW